MTVNYPLYTCPLFLSQMWKVFVFGVTGFPKVLPQFPSVATFLNVAEDAQRFLKIGRDSFRVSKENSNFSSLIPIV